MDRVHPPGRRAPRRLAWVLCVALGASAHPARAADPIDFDVWAAWNARLAQSPAPGYGRHITPYNGPMPVRPGVGKAAGGLVDAFMPSFKLLHQLPENLGRLGTLAHEEARRLRPGQVKEYDVLMDTDGFGNPTRVKALREVGPAQVGPALPGARDSLGRQPASLPVSAGRVWVDRTGYHLTPPGPPAPLTPARWPLTPPLGSSLRSTPEYRLGVDTSLGQPAPVLKPLPRQQPTLGVDTKLPTGRLPTLPSLDPAPRRSGQSRLP